MAKYKITTTHGIDEDKHKIIIDDLTSVELWQILKIIEKN